MIDTFTRKMIASEYWDDGSYWIDLRRGWRMPGDAHGIVESTREAARARLDEVEPCDCADCESQLIERADDAISTPPADESSAS